VSLTLCAQTLCTPPFTCHPCVCGPGTVCKWHVKGGACRGCAVRHRVGLTCTGSGVYAWGQGTWGGVGSWAHTSPVYALPSRSPSPSLVRVVCLPHSLLLAHPGCTALPRSPFCACPGCMPRCSLTLTCLLGSRCLASSSAESGREGRHLPSSGAPGLRVTFGLRSLHSHSPFACAQKQGERGGGGVTVLTGRSLTQRL
jgi:hypothetical protein